MLNWEETFCTFISESAVDLPSVKENVTPQSLIAPKHRSKPSLCQALAWLVSGNFLRIYRTLVTIAKSF